MNNHYDHEIDRNPELVDPFCIRAVWHTRSRDPLFADDWTDESIAFEHGNLIEMPPGDLTAGQVIMQWRDDEGNWHDFQ